MSIVCIANQRPATTLPEAVRDVSWVSMATSVNKHVPTLAQHVKNQMEDVQNALMGGLEKIVILNACTVFHATKNLVHVRHANPTTGGHSARMNASTTATCVV